jgi:hypothetical protein
VASRASRSRCTRPRARSGQDRREDQVLKKGKVASIDPKGRLKPGDYQIRFSTKLIKDVHGNNLVPSNVESLTSARVRTDLHVGR